MTLHWTRLISWSIATSLLALTVACTGAQEAGPPKKSAAAKQVVGSADVMGIEMGLGQDDAGSPPSVDPPLSSDTPDPWWQRIEFNPALGTPAGLEWQDSAYLDAEDLSGLLSQDEFAQFEASGLAFELRLDADRDGTPELYQVGVYRTVQDDAGTFVSVRQDGALLKVFPDEGRAGCQLGDLLRGRQFI